MSEREEWYAQVAAWKEKYKVTVCRKKSINVGKAKAYQSCRKCGGRASVRHHKGEDYFFARLFPDTYAKRYCEFRPRDIVWLCNDCHNKAHKANRVIRNELYKKYYKVKEQTSGDNGYSIYGWIITISTAEGFRQRYIRKCNSWLKRKKRNVRNDRKKDLHFSTARPR